MYFAPDPTIVSECINIGSARPNKILTVMNLLASVSESRYTCPRACDFLCVLNTMISLVTSTGGVRKEGKEQNTPYTLINMYFTPELTIVCKHININVAKSNKK